MADKPKAFILDVTRLPPLSGLWSAPLFKTDSPYDEIRITYKAGSTVSEFFKNGAMVSYIDAKAFADKSSDEFKAAKTKKKAGKKGDEEEKDFDKFFYNPQSKTWKGCDKVSTDGIYLIKNSKGKYDLREFKDHIPQPVPSFAKLASEILEKTKDQDEVKDFLEDIIPFFKKKVEEIEKKEKKDKDEDKDDKGGKNPPQAKKKGA